MKNHQENEQLEAILQMRDMMERSSKFLSLSGLAGIIVGCLAMVGVAFAYWILSMPLHEINYLQFIESKNENFLSKQIHWLMLDAILVLFLALITGSFLAIRNAKRKGLSIWDATTKRLIYNMFIPLFVGMFLIIAFMLKGQIQFVLPIMLIFYGLALFNASKYAIDEINFLGVLEIGLGIIAIFWVELGLLIWLLGFGILHIIYGSVIYFKYEK